MAFFPVRAPARLAWLRSVPEVRWAAVSTAAFAVALLARLGGGPRWAVAGLYAVCYAAGGWEPALAGLQALRRRTLDVDVLMVVAALAAAAIGQVFDGALLIVIFATSGALEAVMTQRTAASVRALLDFAPQSAVRLGPAGDEQQIPAAELVAGDLVLVRPGERVPGDGRVQGGESELDQAALTGEPLPVRRGPGEHVLAGTLNGTGVLTVRVERAAADTVLARVASQVQEASEVKAATQLFIDRVEQRYSVLVVAVTLTLIAVPLGGFGAHFTPTLLRAMTFMIVASPCAVVLATMPPLLSVIANAGRHGVLVKNAVVLEQLAGVDTVALDKTGTLTHGTPRVTDILGLNGRDETQLLTLAAGAEAPSEHPLGRAVAAAARARGLRVPSAQRFRARPGRGVQARVDDRDVLVGHPVLLPEGAPGDPARALVAELETAGRTAVVVVVDGHPAGVLALSDTVRRDAPVAVSELARLVQRSPVLLTGDNVPAARRLAVEVGIDTVHAGLLPQDKTAAVRTLQQTGRRVLLVGDGVNDAPALATADVGIAMGGAGSDLALQAADAVVVRDDLRTVPAVLTMARRARRVVIANLAFAATIITVLVGWDLLAHLPLPLGVAGHEGSTVVVGLNGLRLLSRRTWPTLNGERPAAQRAADDVPAANNHPQPQEALAGPGPS